MDTSGRTCLQLALLLSRYMHSTTLKSTIWYFNEVVSLEKAKTFTTKNKHKT